MIWKSCRLVRLSVLSLLYITFSGIVVLNTRPADITDYKGSCRRRLISIQAQ
ncbi:hypothetical protein HMPREF3293_00989 [Christensenella minuta]|uniref:Uncharacterized protein n=1 Tax=Christensenella minuta TaxID=626937 RepID=A0A136Q6I8_9FIRM|nr:hypothetical protein HMPREF3293_00989 [Christensenella minuta]